MNEKEKLLREISHKGKHELDLPEFYKALNIAIHTKNMQSVYGLSKIFTRYYFKNLDI